MHVCIMLAWYILNKLKGNNGNGIYLLVLHAMAPWSNVHNPLAVMIVSQRFDLFQVF